VRHTIVCRNDTTVHVSICSGKQVYECVVKNWRFIIAGERQAPVDFGVTCIPDHKQLQVSE